MAAIIKSYSSGSSSSPYTLFPSYNKRENFRIQEKYLWPVIGEKYAVAGEAGNYFLQDLWAANKILHEGVKAHFDIGSRLPLNPSSLPGFLYL